MKCVLILIGFICFAQGCTTRAPSSYELSRRSGDGRLTHRLQKTHLELRPTTSRSRVLPQGAFRTQPVLEKVWIFPTVINETAWLEGTWVYLEVEPSQWDPQAPRPK